MFEVKWSRNIQPGKIESYFRIQLSGRGSSRRGSQSEHPKAAIGFSEIKVKRENQKRGEAQNYFMSFSQVSTWHAFFDGECANTEKFQNSSVADRKN